MATELTTRALSRRATASGAATAVTKLSAPGAGAVRFPGEACFRVTQVASGIGSKPRHRGTLRALGLGRIGKSRDLPDRPEIRGMLSSVAHLIEVVPVAAPSGGTGAPATAKAAKATGATATEPATEAATTGDRKDGE